VGIVVTVAMLAALCVFIVKPISIFRKPSFKNVKAHFLIGVFLLIAGVWNALWYGAQHLSQFWGQAAFISGLIMAVSAVVILTSLRRPGEVVARRWFHWLLIVGLLLSFLLYAITLIQLNLGMEIIR